MSAGPPPVTIAARFSGPPGTANGGYTAGLLAVWLPAGAVEVTLRQPPLLETRLDLSHSDGRTTLTFGGAVIAEAVPADLTTDAVDPVPPEQAAAAMTSYAGLEAHPFPGCFVCGTDRPRPDGLGLRPGRLTGRPDTVATTWTPDSSLCEPGSSRVRPEMVWAALDCPGGWSADLVGRPMVLGRMTARVDALPSAGDRCVVVGRWLGAEGRKTFTASTAYDADGRILGRSQATWIAIDPDRLGS